MTVPDDVAGLLNEIARLDAEERDLRAELQAAINLYLGRLAPVCERKAWLIAELRRRTEPESGP